MKLFRIGCSTRTTIISVMQTTAVIVACLALTHSEGLGAENRSGEEVVSLVCSTCHGEGLQGAPRIGDVKAWSERASHGLTALSQNAIDGIRLMPTHGGNLEITNFEIKRAVTYMVNQSGGSWTEPLDMDSALTERSSEMIVRTQCVKCHQDGKGGAPRIGDKKAWVPRLAQGLDRVIRSAINGHGGMPPRGGMVNLTDNELQNAVLYMFNPDGLSLSQSDVVPEMGPGTYQRVIGDVAIYIGIAPTDSIRPEESAMHGGIPKGKDYYHINVSLLDVETNEQIADADVDLTIKDPVRGSKRKDLEVMTINKMTSYGNYFQLTGWDSYSITVNVRRPGMPHAFHASFQIPLKTGD